jgi:hypothetical protein
MHFTVRAFGRGRRAARQRAVFRVCLTLFSGLLAAHAGLSATLTVRQLDSSRSPKIDILAGVSPEVAVSDFTVSELDSKKNALRAAELVKPAAVRGLLAAESYPYKKPLVALVVTAAGKKKALAQRLAGDAGYARQLAATFGNMPQGALRVYFHDPLEGKLAPLPNVDGISQSLTALAQTVDADRPKGVMNALFADADHYSIDLVGVLSTLAKAVETDRELRSMPAVCVAALWFGGPVESKPAGVTPGALVGRNVMINIAEAASTDAGGRVSGYCSATDGSLTEYDALRGKRGTLLYEKAAAAARRSLDARFANVFLLTAETKNVEHVLTGYFDIGIVGQNIQERLSFVRGDVNREGPVLALSETFHVQLGSGRFVEAKGILDRMEEIITGSGQQYVAKLRQEWSREVIKLARDGRVKEALDQLNALGRAGLIDPEVKRQQEENIHWEAAWHAADANDVAGCRTALLEWRRMVRDSERYAEQKDRAKQAAEKLALAAFEDEDPAAYIREVAELGKLDQAARHAMHWNLGWKSVKAGALEKGKRELLAWRNLTKRAGTYTAAAHKAAEICDCLLNDALKRKNDSEIAAEINELYSLLPHKFNDSGIRDRVGTWLFDPAKDRRLFTSRATLVTRWALIDALLVPREGEPEELGYYRRVWQLARYYGKAVDVRNAHRKDALKASSIPPEYVALNRAIVLVKPIRAVFDFAIRSGITPEGLAELFGRATKEFNNRQANLYNNAAVSLFDEPELKIIPSGQEDFGYGVHVAEAFLKRLFGEGGAETALFLGTLERKRVGVLLFAFGDGRIGRLCVADQIAPAVQSEMRVPLNRGSTFNTSLNILDVRDAELTANCGAQLLAEVIKEKGVEIVMSAEGREFLEFFHRQIPEGVRGFLIFNAMTVVDGALAVSDSIVLPDDLDAAIKDKPRRNRTVASYAIWEEPYYEVGIPIRRVGVRGVAGNLRVGVKGLPR